MQGLKVGHFTKTESGTGATVFLFDGPARGGYLICGAGPASHELAPLSPDTSVQSLHALFFSGGSAFGLYAAKGVMQYLVERDIGLTLPHGVVPIVPAAAIYDLAYKAPQVPTDEEAYQACVTASADDVSSGRIGAGTGATVGKIVPEAMRATAGIGRAVLTLADGLEVVAYAVVNAIGDVGDDKNNIVAGARFNDGQFANCEKYLLKGSVSPQMFRHQSHHNTTLVAVFTNAHFNKSELTRLAKMAIAGMARAIKPIFTCFDGDILFCVSLGDIEAPLLRVGTLAAEAVRLSILDAVKTNEVVA